MAWTKPVWMEYADLASKWTVPFAIFGATATLGYFNNERQGQETRLRACIDQQFKLADFACKSGECDKLSPSQGQKLADLTSSVREICKSANFAISQGVANSVQQQAASTDNVEVSGAVDKALGKTAQALAPGNPANTPPLIAKSGTPEGSGGTPPPRLYVQISTEEQRDPARYLIKRLQGADFQGRPLLPLGPDLKPIRTTQLRCVRRVDCASAPQLASYLSTVMGIPVPITDLSAQYEDTSTTRLGHYELWIAPGPIRVVGTSLADGIVGPKAKAELGDRPDT